MEEFEKFREEVLKIHDKRNHKIKNSHGIYEAYKYIRKNKWFNIPRPLTEGEFYSIIRTVNNYLAEELVKGNYVTLPHRMGRIEVRPYRVKYPYKASGKIVYPVNWGETLKLWSSDSEAYKDRIVIYDDAKEHFKVHYNKSKATYDNKMFFAFKVNRALAKTIKNKLREGELAAFIQ